MTERDNTWIRRFHPAPESSPRLVCFPHAGGSATYFFPISRILTPDIEVLAVQYPGRQDRRTEPPIDSIAELADILTEELRGWWDRPTAFFGHSMGATLAFEVARRIEREGRRLTALFASGRRAPSLSRDERCHTLPDDQLLAEIRGLAGTDAALLADDELIRMILPAVRADYRAAETYRYPPGTDLSCPLHALTGDDDPKATVEEAAAWQAHTSSAFQLHVYPGGHFYLNSHATEVLAVISRQLLRNPSSDDRQPRLTGTPST
jgi:surfactin synthase thioesterase subunit